MRVPRSPAIVLSLALGAAALLGVPGTARSDGGTAQDTSDVVRDRDSCDLPTTHAKLRVSTLDDNTSRLLVVGTVWSADDDAWSWKLKHNGDVSDDWRARANPDDDRSFRIARTMINAAGPDDVVFRAENEHTGEVCRTAVTY